MRHLTEEEIDWQVRVSCDLRGCTCDELEIDTKVVGGMHMVHIAHDDDCPATRKEP